MRMTTVTCSYRCSRDDNDSEVSSVLHVIACRWTSLDKLGALTLISAIKVYPKRALPFTRRQMICVCQTLTNRERHGYDTDQHG